MQTFIKKIFILILFTTFFLPMVSFAAEISLYSTKDKFALNESFLVQVFLDTKDATVNAVEGTVVFPSDVLELKETRDGNSAINFWVEKPHSVVKNEVNFSGINTGGFSGQKRFLFSMVFEIKKLESNVISFNNIQVLENNGLGTKISTTEMPFSFYITKEPLSVSDSDLALEDTETPESFVPSVASDSTMFDGKNFIVFSTVDKVTGIDHFEIKESPWIFGVGSKYIKAESPYVLKDQTLKSEIYIKAVDRGGNERIVKIGAQNNIILLMQYFIIGIIICVCIFSLKKIWPKFFRQ